MRLILASLVALLAPGPSLAALPPVYQNDKDLTVMVDFARSHPTVMESLRAIDLERREIRYGAQCVARFERPRQPGMMPGPAPALRFSGSTCADAAASQRVPPLVR